MTGNLSAKLFALAAPIRQQEFFPTEGIEFGGPTPGGQINSQTFNTDVIVNTGGGIDRGIIEGTIAAKIADFMQFELPRRIREITGGTT